MPTVTLNLPDTTFVSSAQPSANFSVYPLMYVGTDPSYFGCTSLINVALPTLPKKVDSAFLQLSVIVKSDAAPSTVAVSQLSAAFDAKTVTYSSMPALIPTATTFNVSASDLYTSIQVDVTDIANTWVSGAVANNGIALTNSDGTIIQFGTNNIVYVPYFPKLIIRYSDTPVPTEQPYGYIYNTDGQSVDQERAIQFTSNGPMEQMTHDVGSDSIAIQSAGLYAVWYRVTGMGANQFAVFQNAAVLLNSTYGTNEENNTGMVIVNAAAGDVVTLRNHTSSGSVTLNSTAGGVAFGVSASLTLLKIGPNAVPDPLLTAVNAAQDTAAMLAAIQNPALGLNLSAFNQLSVNQQQYVLGALIANRPTLGYLTIPDVQAMLDYWVAFAQTNVPDLNNIYVKAGAAGGNGSIGLPFGTIQAGIDAVNPGGIVHVLTGIYGLASTLQVNKPDIQFSIENFAHILTWNEIGVNITGDGVRFSGFLIFGFGIGGSVIAINANRVTVSTNSIEGMHVEFRTTGISVSPGLTGVSVLGNDIHFVSTGMALSDGLQNSAVENHITHADHGIDLYGGYSVSGNSWDANTFDIVIFSGDYNAYQLQAENNNANVRDDRTT